MKRLLKNLFGTQTKTITRKQVRLGLEALEDRQLMTVTALPDAANPAILKITSDNASDVIRVVQDDTNDRLQVFAGSSTTPLLSRSSSEFTEVRVNLGGGNDRLTYRLADGSDFEHTKSISIQGGLGNDTTTLDFSRNGAAEIKANLAIGVSDLRTFEVPTVPGVAAIVSAAGADKVEANFGKLDDDVGLTLFGALGIGNDSFKATLQGDLADPFDPARVLIQYQGDSDRVITDPVTRQPVVARDGADTVEVNAGSTSAVDAEDSESTLTVLLFGGDGNDTMTCNYDGEMDGALTVILAGQNGADRLTANITLDDGSDGSLSAEVNGGAGSDNLRFRLVDNADDGFVFLSRRIRGGAGTDTCFRTANVDQQECEVNNLIS
jgi:hypothetical protein